MSSAPAHTLASPSSGFPALLCLVVPFIWKSVKTEDTLRAHSDPKSSQWGLLETSKLCLFSSRLNPTGCPLNWGWSVSSVSAVENLTRAGFERRSLSEDDFIYQVCAKGQACIFDKWDRYTFWITLGKSAFLKASHSVITMWNFN